ncbi:MAG: pilus assembly protein [Gemmatimonadetes bacterium]|nr:pilus assembly protein [Gemmatimonadota bacterium]
MEFILAVPIVILVLAGIVEFGRHYHARLTLRHAVAEAGRFAVTGQVLQDTLGNPMTRAQSITHKIQTAASDLNVQVTELNITPPDAGGPGEVVTIDATYRFQFVMPGIKQLFGGGYVDFATATSVYNEPF